MPFCIFASHLLITLYSIALDAAGAWDLKTSRGLCLWGGGGSLYFEEAETAAGLAQRKKM